MTRLLSILLLMVGSSIAQSYQGYDGTDYVPLPGCPQAAPCTNPIVPPNCATCSSTSSNWTSAGQLVGAGYEIVNGDSLDYGPHPVIRLTDATCNINGTFSAPSDGTEQNSNVDSTAFAVNSNYGTSWIIGFDPSSATVSPCSIDFPYQGSLAFSHIYNNKVFILSHYTCNQPGICSEKPAPEIDEITLGNEVSGVCTSQFEPGGVPCPYSSTVIVNWAGVNMSGFCTNGQLPASYENYGWNSGFAIDWYDSSFTVGFSLGAQGTGTIVANYSTGAANGIKDANGYTITQGTGCRFYHTDSGIVTGDLSSGVTSCSDGTADCYDGTSSQTNTADVTLDWKDSISYSLNTVIFPYYNNAHNCTFQVQTAGKSASCTSDLRGSATPSCQAAYPNFNALENSGSMPCASSSGALTDGTVVWQLNPTNSGVVGGFCGPNQYTGTYGVCNPVTETSRYTLHETEQELEPDVASPGASANAGASANGCLQELGLCQNNNLGPFIWYPINTLNVTSCFEGHAQHWPDWSSNTTLSNVDPWGQQQFLYPRNGNSNQYYARIGGDGGTTLNLSYATAVLPSGDTIASVTSGKNFTLMAPPTVAGTNNLQVDSTLMPGGWPDTAGGCTFTLNSTSVTCAGGNLKSTSDAGHGLILSGEPIWTQTNSAVVWDGSVQYSMVAVGTNDGTCTGHGASGYLHHFNATQYYTNLWHNFIPYFSQTKTTFDADYHGTYLNSDQSDLNPVFLDTTRVDNPIGSGKNCGQGPCWLNPLYEPFWNEVVGFSPSYSHPNEATYLRMAHTFNSGANGSFSVQNAIGIVSQDGNWLQFTSDREGTLGGERGGTSCQLDGPASVTALYQTNHSYAAGTVIYPRGDGISNQYPYYYVSSCQGGGSPCTSGSNQITNWNQDVGDTFCDNGQSSCPGGLQWTTTYPACRADNFLIQLRAP